GVHGRTGVGADRVSVNLRCSARRSAAGIAGPVSGRTAVSYGRVLPTAQGILRHREHLPAAGVDGAGAHPVAGTTALPSAGRMGQIGRAGPNPGSAHAAREIKLLCQNLGRAMRWNAQLAKDWIARQNDAELYFYCDGHV